MQLDELRGELERLRLLTGDDGDPVLSTGVISRTDLVEQLEAALQTVEHRLNRLVQAGAGEAADPGELGRRCYDVEREIAGVEHLLESLRAMVRE